MTYYEYVKAVRPERVCDGFVGGCPTYYGLPDVECSGICVDCYASHVVPEWMVAELDMKPPCGEELEKLIGGVV